MDKNFKLALTISAFFLVVLLSLAAFINKEVDKLDTSGNIENNIAGNDKEPGNKFSNAEEFSQFLKDIEDNSKNKGWGGMFMEKSFSLPTGFSMSADSSASFANPLSSETGSSSGGDFSQTNVQVQGVDEADIVKTDGSYIYTATRNFITISKAFPSEEAVLLSKKEIENSVLDEMFVEKNSLMIFGRRNYFYENTDGEEIYPYHSSLTFVEIYDISNKNNPVLKRKLEFDGNYKTSRKIGNDVYFVLDSYPRYTGGDIPAEEKCNSLVPQFRDGLEIKSGTAMVPVLKCTDINYIRPVNYLQYVSVVGISINDYKKDFSRKVIMGGSENVYASESNIYLVKTQYQYENNPEPLGVVFDSEGMKEKTQIYKFSIQGGKIEYQNSAEVPGRVLNQFSMDEYESNFRIATTVGHVSRNSENSSKNNIYVLDKNLTLTGSIEDIAPGEQIYSARFMGKRGFLVTFKKVDPFFTLDLSDPKNPKLAGKLKIPGYSDYLHPYDENHIIGIGKNTVESSESMSGTANFAWYQGIKMAMFDVTDFSDPKEMFKIEIGDRGTDSPILSDHKALLFSKEKNLLVIPVLEAKLTDVQKNIKNREGNEYGEYVYQGAYVFNLDLSSGFSLRGKITHFPDDSAFKKSGYYFGSQDYSVKRSLYVGDNLYTVSDGKMKINKLSNLEEIKEINFNISLSNPSIDYIE